MLERRQQDQGTRKKGASEKGVPAVAFSDFDLRTAVTKFALTVERETDLFAAVEPLSPSDFLQPWLEKLAPIALALNSERARSEYIIAPVLVEVKLRLGSAVNVFPGVTLEVDKAQGLAGYCDYLISRSPEIYYIQAPVVAVVEAKKEDLIAGLGQCVAEMVALRLFNERDGMPAVTVHGIVTSGSNWRFLRLEESKLFIDRPEYYLHDVAKILGILACIARG
jgi:hypothetical protein